jgi:hypothetical protein
MARDDQFQRPGRASRDRQAVLASGAGRDASEGRGLHGYDVLSIESLPEGEGNFSRPDQRHLIASSSLIELGASSTISPSTRAFFEGRPGIHPAPARRATWSLVTKLFFGLVEPFCAKPGHSARSSHHRFTEWGRPLAHRSGDGGTLAAHVLRSAEASWLTRPQSSGQTPRSTLGGDAPAYRRRARTAMPTRLHVGTAITYGMGAHIASSVTSTGCSRAAGIGRRHEGVGGSRSSARRWPTCSKPILGSRNRAGGCGN